MRARAASICCASLSYPTRNQTGADHLAQHSPARGRSGCVTTLHTALATTLIALSAAGSAAAAAPWSSPSTLGPPANGSHVVGLGFGSAGGLLGWRLGTASFVASVGGDGVTGPPTTLPGPLVAGPAVPAPARSPPLSTQIARSCSCSRGPPTAGPWAGRSCARTARSGACARSRDPRAPRVGSRSASMPAARRSRPGGDPGASWHRHGPPAARSGARSRSSGRPAAGIPTSPPRSAPTGARSSSPPATSCALACAHVTVVSVRR